VLALASASFGWPGLLAYFILVAILFY
jgi:hypothetical protein